LKEQTATLLGNSTDINFVNPISQSTTAINDKKMLSLKKAIDKWFYQSIEKSHSLHLNEFVKDLFPKDTLALMKA